MSYTTRFNDTISGTVSGSVSYPASEHGGSTSVTLHWQENVNIVVRVEDDPFQDSVSTCRRHVDLMTASVAATEAAQIASKLESSKQIGEAISDGFDGLIQSEISQQMTEIEALMPPRLQELRALSDRCVGLRRQMERDFARIADRYGRLFSDLDSELKRRILTLDQKAFNLCQEVGMGASNDTIKVPVVSAVLSAAEQTGVSNRLQSHRIRQRALGMVESARRHLAASQTLVSGMKGIKADESVDAPRPVMMPVAVIDADGASSGRQIVMLAPPRSRLNDEIQRRQEQMLAFLSRDGIWATMDEVTRKRLGERLNTRIAALANSQGGAATKRKTEMMQRLWEQMRPKAPNGGTR